MTDVTSSPNTNGIEVAMLEKRLEALRDTQESVQGLSLWCQANKKHSTPIIDTWLRVLRRSPVEKRLTMFYLANDVVQHAKKKGDMTVVNQWAVATQKATPHVRSPSSVSTAIIRIFKIWEERGIYSKETVADLISLVSKHNHTGKEIPVESKKRPEVYTASDDKVKNFQSSTLGSVIKQAFKLKSHLGVIFRTKQYVNMNMEQLIASIKDRQHGMSVVENMSELLDACRVSENKLVHEVEERRRIVEEAEVAIVFYENVRAEALIVSNAYKSFTERVIKTKEKVDTMIRDFAEMEGSPIPSPNRLSPFEEVKVLLPSLAELEGRQGGGANLFQQSQSDPKASNSTMDSTSTGMLASGTAYDLMSASQWSNYAMQLQMMQQQMAQAYSAYQADMTAKTQHHHVQPSSSELGAIPLPTDASGQAQVLTNIQQHPPLPSPQTPATPTTTNEINPYDPPNIQQYSNPSSSLPPLDYGSTNNDYSLDDYPEEGFDSNSYNTYDETSRHQQGQGEDEYGEHNTTVPGSTPTGRYHPYPNNTRPPTCRRPSGGGTPRSIFPPQAQPTPFRTPAPIPFNPRNANTTPIIRRGGPRFNSYGRGGHSNDSSTPSTTTGNLLRLAQYQVDPPQNEVFGYQPIVNDYGQLPPDQLGNEGLHVDETDNYEDYGKPLPLLPSLRGRGGRGLVGTRGSRGFVKSPMRGRGMSSGPVGYRGVNRGGRPPRRGTFYIP